MAGIENPEEQAQETIENQEQQQEQEAVEASSETMNDANEISTEEQDAEALREEQISQVKEELENVDNPELEGRDGMDDYEGTQDAETMATAPRSKPKAPSMKLGTIGKITAGLAALFGVVAAPNQAEGAKDPKKIPPQREQVKIPPPQLERNKYKENDQEKTLSIREVVNGVADINHFSLKNPYAKNLGLNQYKIEFQGNDRTRIIKFNEGQQPQYFNMVRDRDMVDMVVKFNFAQEAINQVKADAQQNNINEQEMSARLDEIEKKRAEAIQKDLTYLTSQ
jgi:hypothetical protein